MAAILRHQSAQEFRSPQRPEACGLAYCREAAVQRIDEDGPPRSVEIAEADIVDVDPADHPAFAGYKLAVRSARRGLAFAQHILETPQHVDAAGPERLAVGPKPLTLLDDALVRADPTVTLAANEEQAPGLVGGMARLASTDASHSENRDDRRIIGPWSVAPGGVLMRSC